MPACALRQLPICAGDLPAFACRCHRQSRACGIGIEALQDLQQREHDKIRLLSSAHHKRVPKYFDQPFMYRFAQKAHNARARKQREASPFKPEQIMSPRRAYAERRAFAFLGLVRLQLRLHDRPSRRD